MSLFRSRTVNKRTAMAIYHSHKAIFLHIPKNGGTTVTTLLKRNWFFGRKVNEADEREVGGETIIELMDILGSQAEDYFKFSFVRNPWDRFVSAYHYVCQRRPDMDIVTSHGSFADFVSAFAEEPSKYLQIRYFREQWPYLLDAKGDCPLDFLGRFENFDSDLDTALKQIGIRRFLVRHRKKTKRDDYRTYYNDDTRSLIADIYARDIAEFGYDFDAGTIRKKNLAIRKLNS